LTGGLGFGIKTTPGHSNRVFSCKFMPSDQNMILTGGWDNTVQFWDIRVGAAVRSLYGPHICGDSLDICGMYTYLYECIFIYAYLDVYVYIRMCLFIWVRSLYGPHICGDSLDICGMYTYLYIYEYIFIYMYLNMYIHVRICLFIFIYIHVHVDICLFMYPYIYIYMYMIYDTHMNIGNEILTGSWRPDNQLEIWDYGSGQRIKVRFSIFKIKILCM
jgi:hypothetical protein